MAGGARGGDGSSAFACSAPASHECAAVGASSDVRDGLLTAVGASSDAGDGLLLADNETFVVGVGLGTVITLTAFTLGTPV